MTTVRIAHAEPRPGNLGHGIFITAGYLVVLADDAGHRALPIWFGGHPGGGSLSGLLDRTADDILTSGAPEELNARLLAAAGATVTGVDVEMTGAGAEMTGSRPGGLDPDAFTARIELGGPAGPRHVAAPFGLGLAMAAAAGAPVRVPGAVLDRLAVPVAGDDLLGPLLERVPQAARPPGGRIGGWPARLPTRRPRYEPRNLAFAGGLDWWDIEGSFQRDQSPRPDYSAAAEDGSAVLSAAAGRPTGSAALMQTMFADDYRGATVVFSGEIRTAPLTYEAGLRVEILRDRLRTRHDHSITVAGGRPWTRYEVTAAVPGDAEIVRFGITLDGPGEIALRQAELTRRG